MRPLAIALIVLTNLPSTKSHAYNSAPVLYLGFDVANNISNANVASGTFFYNTNTDIITFDKTIKVANFYSVDGKLVKTINAIANGRTKVNLPTGLYIVRTIDTNGSCYKCET